MPVYQYRCTACREVHEELQKVSDPPLTECPKCHGTLQKIIAPVGIIFKGSGWHINDYKSGGAAAPGEEKPKSEDKPAADAKPSTDSPSTGDSKPATSGDSGSASSSQKQVA